MEKDTKTLKNDTGKEKKDSSENNQYILSLKGPFVINTNKKFQCEMCKSSFKKKVTLKKHKNTKNMKIVIHLIRK